MINQIKDVLLDEIKRDVFLLILSGSALLISLLDMGRFPLDMAWVAIVLCGIPIIKEAITGLVTQFDIKADVLVSLALISAVIIGEIFAAGEVAFIMQLGALLETLTVARARAGIEKLVNLTPQTARVLRNGEEIMVEADQIIAGDILRVSPGETIAVDGIILNGQTSIDESVMTGESLPVDKGAGDEVKSGTINQFGAFDMQATKVGADSSLQRMIELVKSADAGKAKIVGLADRWATWIVVIALTAALSTWFVTGQIIRSVTILVVFCPCALVLATPTAIMAAIGNATKYGILVREGDALERLSQVKKITFDKTGTLTHGKPQVAEIKSFMNDYSTDELFAIAASAELRSEHPLGKAIVSGYKERYGFLPDEPDQFQMHIGRGVVAYSDHKRILAGNAELLRENGIILPDEIRTAALSLTQKGSTIIYLAIEFNVIGFIALADTVRSSASAIVSRLNHMEVKTVLLTGDHKEAASAIAHQVGINEINSDCLPEDKLTIIAEYQSQSEPVCMVGDGINDAPALKVAHVGIAMGGIGSDIAIEAADITFVRDDIQYLPHLLALAKRMMTTIKINIIFSMALNFLAIILAMKGLLNPVWGALVHNAGSVLVIINSSLLLKWKKNPEF